MATANAWAWLFLLCLPTSCDKPATPQQAALVSSDAARLTRPEAAGKIAPPIRTVMQRLRDAGDTPGQAAASPTHPLVRIDASGRVQTDIIVTRVDDEVVTALRAAQVHVEQTNAKQQTIQGWIPVTRVEAVAALPFVRHIRPPSYAIRR